MTEKKYTFKCVVCSKTQDFSDEKGSHLCCDKVMAQNPLTPCTTAEHPEMVRNEDSSDACDDGRGHSDR